MSLSSHHLNNTARFNLTDAEIAILCSVNILFGILGSLGNIFVCFAFVNCRKLRNAMSVFILSLACSDLLVCIVAQPMFVVSLVRSFQQDQVTNVFEDIRKGLSWISLLATAGNLLGVTLDRYVAITNPLRYGSHREVKPSALFFITMIWMIAVGLGVGTGFSSTTKFVGQLYVFVVVTCLIVPLYCRVLYIAGTHSKRIRATIRHHAVDLNYDAHSVTPASRQQRALHDRHKRDRTALRTVGFICGVFIVGWYPLLILPFIYRRAAWHNRKLVLDVFQWVNTLALCSSAANPLVYSLTDRRFRESLKMVHKRWAAKRLVLDTPKSSRNRASSVTSSS